MAKKEQQNTLTKTAKNFNLLFRNVFFIPCHKVTKTLRTTKTL